MAGKTGRSGRKHSTIYGRSYWVSLSPADSDLLPFFQQLDRQLPSARNAAFLAALRGGMNEGQQVAANSPCMVITQRDRVADALDSILDAFEEDL